MLVLRGAETGSGDFNPSRRAFLTGNTGESREQHISSLLVHAQPGRMKDIRAAIEAIPGTEIHAASAAGKLIVTLETEGTGAVSEALAAISGLPGVLSAALVFHQFEQDGM